MDNDVADALNKLYRATSALTAEKLAIGYAPVNARLAAPITISPSATPDIANVPVEFEDAVVIVPNVAVPIVAVVYAACTMLGPDAPILYVPDVILFDMVEFVTVSDVATMVPIVAVPVEAVMLVPKVAGPEENNVPIVAVPVDAVMFDPNVIAPS